MSGTGVEEGLFILFGVWFSIGDTTEGLVTCGAVVEIGIGIFVGCGVAVGRGVFVGIGVGVGDGCGQLFGKLYVASVQGVHVPPPSELLPVELLYPKTPGKLWLST